MTSNPARARRGHQLSAGAASTAARPRPGYGSRSGPTSRPSPTTPGGTGPPSGARPPGFEVPIGKIMPAYLEELRGIADGAGLDLADVLAINVRTEVMYAAKARQAPTTARLPAECSAFACVPAPGQKDPVLIGPELGLAPARGPDAGRAGGPPGRGPGLRHGGRGRPARQDRDERRRPRPGHQRPGDRRGRRRARAALPRAAACRARLHHGHRRHPGAPGRPAFLPRPTT